MSVLVETMPRLRIENLTVVVHGTDDAVVQDASLSLAAGETLALIGESGSGKTTIGHAILGHVRRGLRVASGKVWVDDVDVMATPPKLLRALRGRGITYVPQEPATALNPALRVQTQLGEALAHCRQAEDAAAGNGANRTLEEILAGVQLEATPRILRAYPHQLSGGQQQRVAIAMAFAGRPDVVVLDEPTTGLDVTTQRHVLSVVAELARMHRVAAVYITHDLATVAGIADRVVVCYASRIAESGPAGEVFARPAHPYTQLLLRAAPSRDERTLQGIPGQPPDPQSRGEECLFASRCPLAVPDCRAGRPPLVEVSPGHAASCLRAGTPVPASGASVLAATSAATGGRQLQVTGVRARYGTTEVVHGVDLQVEPGASLALVGESGSGKTTLARTIAGIHRQAAGSLMLDGQPLPIRLKDRSKEQKRLLQYVFQSPASALNPRQTVGQTILRTIQHFEGRSREHEQRVVCCLQDVSLDGGYVGRYPSELSGGEKQRVAIARALAAEPALLVCDEVTSALDVSVQAVLLDLLRTLQRKRRLSMLFITHNLGIVPTIADEVAVLCQGTIVERGPVRQVLEHPSHPYTIQLLTDAPALPQTARLAPTRRAAPDAAGAGQAPMSDRS